MNDLYPRRAFLRAAAAASVTWQVADLLHVEDALAWAASQSSAVRHDALGVLTAMETLTLESMTTRILPSIDGRPGAREAGVIHFIERSLTTFNAGQKTLYRDGVNDLNRRADLKVPGAHGFAALTAAQQDDLLHEIEETSFFQAVRFDTIVGTFAVPAWGGNQNHLGWHLLGLEHQPRFQAPFGFYDAEANKGI